MHEQKARADQLQLAAQKERRMPRTAAVDQDLVTEIKSIRDTNAMLRARYVTLLNSHPMPKHVLALLLQQYQKDFAEVLDLPTVEFDYSPTNSSRPSPTANAPRRAPHSKNKSPSKSNSTKSPAINDAQAKIAQADLIRKLVAAGPDLSLVDAINIVSPPATARKGQESPHTPAPPSN